MTPPPRPAFALAVVLVVGIVLSGVLLVSRVAPAVVPPQRYGLQQEPEKFSISPLESWLRTRVMQPIPAHWPTDSWAKALGTESPLAKAFLGLRRARDRREDLVRDGAAAKDLWKTLTGASIPTPAQDALWPYLGSELLNAGLLTGPDAKAAESFILKAPDGGCPRQRLILREVDRYRAHPAMGTPFSDLIALVNSMESFPARRQAAMAIAGAVPVAGRDKARSDLWPIVRDAPMVLTAHPWLQSHMPTDKAVLERTVTDELFRPVHVAVSRRQCDKATTAFRSGLAKIKGAALPPAALKALQAAAKCNGSRRGKDARIKYLESARPILEKKFGWSAWAEVTLRIASYQWSMDNFDAARRSYQDLISQAAARKQPSVESAALAALGRLEYETGDKAKAVLANHDYLARFGDSPDIADEERSRVIVTGTMILVELGQKDEALSIVDSTIIRESAKAMDLQSSALPFALFWSGRLHAERANPNDQAIARLQWERLASEHVSTFYGAAGHISVERLTGKRFLIEPTHNATFAPANVWSSFFNPARRRAAERSDTLLRFGLRDDALCEARSLQAPEPTSDESFARSLLVHAAGQWFEAIRIFDGLPRSYRLKLPAGAERVIYPRAYENLVRTYASRVDLDPALAMSLIRQESVFNPRAQSPVGAIGLMQLMPATAKKETRLVAAGYMTPPPYAIPAPMEDDVTLDSTAEPPLTSPTSFESASESPATAAEAPDVVGATVEPEPEHPAADVAISDVPPPIVPPLRPGDTGLLREDQNLALGIHHLKRMLDKFGDPIPTLCSYNAGASVTKRWTGTFTNEAMPFIEFIPYAETRNYVKLIMRNYFYYARYRDLQNGVVNTSGMGNADALFRAMLEPGAKIGKPVANAGDEDADH